MEHAPFDRLSLLAGQPAERSQQIWSAFALDQLELIVLNVYRLHAKTPTRLVGHPAPTHRIHKQMLCDAQQPHGSRPSLRIELLATLECPREGLRDEIEHQIRSCSRAPAQIGANQRIRTFVQRPEILGTPTRQQLLVTALD